jgi:cation diffusion facilitator CzcD-associated flavoprotein CzcO
VRFLRRALPARYADDAVRWALALGTQATYVLSKRHPSLVRRVLRRGVQRQLPRGYDVDTHFTPAYDPWDQRLCAVPDGDLFKAISAGRASIVTDRIDTFTETGLRLESGAELEADIIVTATGLELLFIGGIELTVDGEPVDIAERLTYKGMMLEGVPNLALAVGYTNASWTLKCDLTCGYVTRLLNHLHTTGNRQCTPRNHDPRIAAQPLLGLSSGYVQRSADRFPKQGTAFPWQAHQSYLRDYRLFKRSRLEDDAMEFTSPVPSQPGVLVDR